MPPRHQEGRFRHPITRVAGLLAKTVRSESLGKTFERLRSNRLGSIERDLPSTQVDPFHLVVRNLVDAVVVGEIGTTADGDAKSMDRLQPAHRPTQKGERRHQDIGNTNKHRHDDAANQPHVVIQG